MTTAAYGRLPPCQVPCSMDCDQYDQVTLLLFFFFSEGAEGWQISRTNKLLSDMPCVVLIYVTVVSTYS